MSASASNASVVAEGPLSESRRGSWLVSLRKSYLQYILNRIDFGDQPPLAFGFTDGEGRLDYDLTPKVALSLNFLDGSSSVDRSRFKSELSPTTLMTSGFHFTLINVGSRYATSRLLINNHVAVVARKRRGGESRPAPAVEPDVHRDDGPERRHLHVEQAEHAGVRRAVPARGPVTASTTQPLCSAPGADDDARCVRRVGARGRRLRAGLRDVREEPRGRGRARRQAQPDRHAGRDAVRQRVVRCGREDAPAVRLPGTSISAVSRS